MKLNVNVLLPYTSCARKITAKNGNPPSFPEVTLLEDVFSSSNMSFVEILILILICKGGSRGRVQGVRTPPEMTCGFLISNGAVCFTVIQNLLYHLICILSSSHYVIA